MVVASHFARLGFVECFGFESSCFCWSLWVEFSSFCFSFSSILRYVYGMFWIKRKWFHFEAFLQKDWNVRSSNPIVGIPPQKHHHDGCGHFLKSPGFSIRWPCHGSWCDAVSHLGGGRLTELDDGFLVHFSSMPKLLVSDMSGRWWFSL